MQLINGCFPYRYIIPIQLFMLFMFLWIMNFMVALSEITLAGAFASHYWAWDKSKDIPALPLISSLYRALRLVCNRNRLALLNLIDLKLVLEHWVIIVILDVHFDSIFIASS